MEPEDYGGKYLFVKQMSFKSEVKGGGSDRWWEWRWDDCHEV